MKEELKDKFLSSNDLVKDVYKDTLQPSLKRVGKVGEDILKFVALPFTFLGLTAGQLEDKYKKFIAESINKVPEARRELPKSAVASPLLEHVKYLFGDEEESKNLIEMFSELLANASNTDKKNTIHTSFVYTLLQLGSIEAEVLRKIYIASDDYRIIGVTFRKRGIGDKRWIYVLSDEAEPSGVEEENVFFYYNIVILNGEFRESNDMVIGALNVLEHHNLISSFKINKYKNEDNYSLEKHTLENLNDFDPYGSLVCYKLTQYGKDFMNACVDAKINSQLWLKCINCNIGFKDIDENGICPRCGEEGVK
ncbi:MAG: DUF4393 domain-containing protein [Lachnospiraceae bacterium]|nr:DUF4393 domain-containing protein [Lachnospiraceae bacterium]